jgi:deazaflavin-dependent oxidoreductase (nitroreductase family)
MNPTVRRTVRMGISVWGARELRVRGRHSGLVRSTVVNVLDLDGARYLVAPRGTTEWVRNVRTAGRAELRVGRRIEAVEPVEVVDADRQVAVLRAYLRRWRFEVGQFFDGIGPDSTDAELAAIAVDHPVFVLTAPPTGRRPEPGPRSGR